MVNKFFNRVYVVFFLFCCLVSSLVKASIDPVLLTQNELRSDIINYYKESPEYFDFDLQKYRMRGKDKAGACMKTCLPIGIGGALCAIIGNPVAIVPIAMGVATGASSIKNIVDSNNTKRVLKGAYLYLNPDFTKKPGKIKKYTKSFNSFYNKIKKDELEVINKEQAALKILYINHFAPLIIKRLQNDPELTTYENLYKKLDVSNDAPWNLKFIYKYFTIIDKALSGLASHNSFDSLNHFNYGLFNCDAKSITNT